MALDNSTVEGIVVDALQALSPSALKQIATHLEDSHGQAMRYAAEGGLTDALQAIHDDRVATLRDAGLQLRALIKLVAKANGEL